MAKIVLFRYLAMPLFLSFFMAMPLAHSQNLTPGMATDAKLNFENYQFYKALELYKVLDSLDPNNPKYIYPIAVCNMNLGKYEIALTYLEKCLEAPSKYPRNLDAYAAKAYHLSNKFDDAIIHYDIYKHKLKGGKKNKKEIDEIDREIEICKYAKEQFAKSSNIKIINLGKEINSSYGEYGAVLSADEQVIIFTSGRPNTIGGKIDNTDGRYYEDIYISTKTDSGWTAPKQLGSEINTEGNDASIGLSPDGQKLLIYRHQDGNVLSGGSSGDLYISRLKGTNWTQATKLPESINTKAWEPSACLSSDERILYFSSNKDGGLGGTDIYMVKKLPNGDWAMPMNLGNKINTPYDEDSPFIHPDGKTLYFSSNGHRTMGGFDIFVTKYDEEKNEWSIPENIGYPINTSNDDIHFSWTANGRRVYFSSIRPGGLGDNDIYYADINKESADVLVLKGMILDSISKQPVEASIKVFDSNTNELIGVYNSNSSTGQYIIIFNEGRKYNMTIEADRYKLYFENLDLSDIKGFEEKQDNIELVPRK